MGTRVSYLVLCKKLPPKFSSLLSHFFCRSGIQEPLNCMVLIWDLLRSNSPNVGTRCNWGLAGQDGLLSWLEAWCGLLGGGLWSLLCGPLPKVLLYHGGRLPAM